MMSIYMRTIAKPSILIVEDDELIRRMYQQIFTFRGYSVKLATNGEEGLEKVAVDQPAIILLDIMMPKLNGIEMLKRLKAQPDAAKIPVIILTNLMGAADAEAALAAGAVTFVSKSDYTPKEIVDIVEHVLAERATASSKVSKS
jgi:CheY-like chemotaxis protein